jgi:protein TonB
MRLSFHRANGQGAGPGAFGALLISLLAHGLAVAGMASLAGPAACPAVMPRIVLTASLAPPGCGSGAAGPAPAAAEAVAEAAPAPDLPQPPPEPPATPLETVTARADVPAAVLVPKKEPVAVKPKQPPPPVVKAKPAVKPQPPKADSEPREVAAAAAAAPAEAARTGPGGGSGASSGPPLPAGGGAGPGSLGSPLAAGELDNQPALVFSPKPEYPFQAKRRGLRGRLRVRLLVDKVGRVERVEILGGENVEDFAESVRTTLARWRFKPGTQKGTPVHWVAVLPIAFEQE